jgi:hypothetical protein
MRISLSIFLFFFISCKSQTNSDKVSSDDGTFSEIESEKKYLNEDTSYTPLTIKFGKLDSVTVMRKYFDNAGNNRFHELILVNGKQAYIDTSHTFDYQSEYNRVMIDKGNIFLFLESDGSPNFNAITAFSISNSSVDFVSDCVYNDEKQRGGPAPFTDIDDDGFLEYGGFDLTEHYGNDSMYYIPSEFYEIRNGRVLFDSTLTIAMDKKENGVYIENPLNSNGFCCVLVKRPKYQKK